MNRRQWKKACKKAAAKLQRLYPGQYEYVPARGDETVYSPRGYEPLRHEGRLGRHYTEVPKGAPIRWYSCHTDCGTEWDVTTALSDYQFMQMVESTDWEAEWKKYEQT